MTSQSSTSSSRKQLPRRQRSIYEPRQLDELRAESIVIPKPPLIERDDSYTNSLYANRQAYYDMQEDSHKPRQRLASDEAKSIIDYASGHSQGSKSPSGKRRYLKKLNKRTSGVAADLVAVYMLKRGLDSVSD